MYTQLKSKILNFIPLKTNIYTKLKPTQWVVCDFGEWISCRKDYYTPDITGNIVNY